MCSLIQALLSWLLKGGVDTAPLKGIPDIDVEVDVDADIDRYWVSKPV